jgi:hypothetical protein
VDLFLAVIQSLLNYFPDCRRSREPSAGGPFVDRYDHPLFKRNAMSGCPLYAGSLLFVVNFRGMFRLYRPGLVSRVWIGVHNFTPLKHVRAPIDGRHRTTTDRT